MIFDSIENYKRYEGMKNNIYNALIYLRTTDLANASVGRIDLDGDFLFALVQEYQTKPLEQSKWEAHRKYIDIQYMISGQERMGFVNIQKMQLGEFVDEKDFQPMTGSGNFVDVSAGSFTIFYPDDGHMPGICIGSPSLIKKVVIKAKI